MFQFRFIACLVAASLFNPADANADDTLDSAKTAHHSGREAIRTFSAKIKCDGIQPPRPNVIDASYWRSGDDVRVHANTNSGGTSDWLNKDSELKQVGIAKDSKGVRQHLARVYKPTDSIGLCDVWSQMLIDLHLPDGGQVPLDRFLELGKSAPRVKKDDLNGVPCIRLTTALQSKQHGEVKYVIWLDRSRNHLVRKIEMVFGKKPCRFESEIVEFAEPAPGVHVPMRCVNRSWDGDRYDESAATLRDVRVNTPIPAGTFVLPSFPDGTILENEILGVQYPVDKQWQKSGKEEPLLRIQIPAADDEFAEFNTPSTTEPRSLSRICIEAAILAFALASAIVFIRRRRNRSMP